MDTIKDMTTLKAIAKRYHLEFCPKFKYYEGNAYNNSKGETLPQYFPFKGRIFALKYFSGCFNPFLVDVTLKVRNEINAAYDRKVGKDQEWQERIQNYIDNLEAMFNVK